MTRQSLVAFAEHTPARPVRCWMCLVPERAECEAAYVNGVGISVIHRWLADECGYGPAVTRNKVQHHFDEHVVKAAR